MYEWSMSLNGVIIIGREWQEFIEVLDYLSEYLKLDSKRRLIFYVHNLSYEFQFFRKLFEWESVFSLSERKICYAVTKSGIEFRCSYILSGYSLSKLSDQIVNYKVSKKEGDLDYSLIRHSKTELTRSEIEYCINDVLVVTSYIWDRIVIDGDISKIPLTKTGYVRRYMRQACLYNHNPPNSREGKKQYYKYRHIMNELTLEIDEYKQLKRAFQGGFTHCSAWKANTQKPLENVSSYDFTSSYPAVMVSEKFPMSKAECIDIHTEEEFAEQCKEYCCLADAHFTNIRDKLFIEHIISESRCFQRNINGIVDNGRIVEAKEIYITITEQDYFAIKEFYEWDNLEVINFRRYKKGYLPRVFVDSLLDLYKKKTELKGVKGKEHEYMAAKENVNACYGMMVTDICRPEIIYEYDEFSTVPVNVDESIPIYNNSKTRFLFYPWGVWVTAYARTNLFTGILAMGSDYCYSDTDSLKILNRENHLEFFDWYDSMIIDKINEALDFHMIDREKANPKTLKGQSKMLGVWDYEYTADYFKSLGAKRYLVFKGNELELTVSGLNKRTTIDYMLEKSNGDIEGVFDMFAEGLVIPEGKTGKMVHTYIDYETEGEVTDYKGQKAHYHELSSVHLEGAGYSLSLSQRYSDYINKVKRGVKQW